MPNNNFQLLLPFCYKCGTAKENQFLPLHVIEDLRFLGPCPIVHPYLSHRRPLTVTLDVKTLSKIYLLTI